MQKLLVPSEHAPLLIPRHTPIRPSSPVVGITSAFAGGRNSLSQKITVATKVPVFPQSRLYFVPGYMDYMPSPVFLNTLHQAAGHGLAVLMASPDEGYHDNHSFTLVGGRDGFYLPDWRRELPTLVQRLYVDLREAEFSGHKPEKLIFVGHSKGGLLLHGLAVLSKRVEGHNAQKLFDEFPGLQLVPAHVVQYVGQALLGAAYLAIGTPFDGVNPKIQRLARLSQFDRFFGGTSQFYHPDFLNAHYAKTGTEPESVIQAVITSQPFSSEHKPGMGKLLFGSALRLANPFSPKIYDSGITLFDAAGHFMAPEGMNDGLVDVSPREFPHSTHLEGYNHITQVGDTTADKVIKLLREIV